MDGLNPVFQIDKLMRYKKVIDEQKRNIMRRKDRMTSIQRRKTYIAVVLLEIVRLSYNT